MLRLAFSPHDVSPVSATEQLVRALHDVLAERDIRPEFDEAQRATLARLPGVGHHAPVLTNEDEPERRFNHRDGDSGRQISIDGRSGA